jgi:sigma-B regulation protein RsbU (phosphoserine phosphatase)
VLQRVNQQLLEMNETGIFVTMLYGVLDTKNQRFSYVRAGHELPLVFRVKDTWLTLERGRGQLMGVLPDPDLEEKRIPLAFGDTLLLYTDGIIESRDENGETFGHDRLREAVVNLRGSPAQDLCRGILHRVNAFRGADVQQDDITMVAVQVN